MLIDVVMPQLGESVVEGVVVKWLVAAGDAVAKDQALLEISTDKVDAEIPSPAAGRVSRLLVKEGETVPVLSVIAQVETEMGAPAPEPEAAPTWDEETEGFPGHMARKKEPPLPAPPRVEPAPPSPKPPSPPPPSAPPAAPEAGRIRVTPVVGRMASTHGLDLSKIPGTGIDGRVTRKDVEVFLASKGVAAPEAKPAAKPEARPEAEPEAAPEAEPEAAPEAAAEPEAAPAAKPAAKPKAEPEAAAEPELETAPVAKPKGKPAPAAPPAPAVAEGDQVVPWTPIRKKIAHHMVASKQTSPHVHIFAEVDMSAAAARRAALKSEGVSLTYLPFVMFAAAKALKEFPAVNAVVHGESTILKKGIHISVAVDTEKGLLVPVVRDADKKSLAELAQAMEDLGARAKAGKVLPDELSGGTFSVTNPGAKGNLFGTPIINQPQVGIIRMGQVVKRPVVIDVDGDDAVVVRPMMFLCMAYDHRVIDGVAGNGFLYRVREVLEAGDFG